MKEVKIKAKRKKAPTDYTINVDIMVSALTRADATQQVSNILSINGIKFWIGETLTDAELSHYINKINPKI